MKSILIYSGKGGVGKTTTTANLAKALVADGKKVYILDADVNTPSMHLIFPKEDHSETLKVRSLGHETEGLIYVQGSVVKKYVRQSIVAIKKFKPDYILIDTPPSITDVHINLLEAIKLSGIVLVTQPNVMSTTDVNRTMLFFKGREAHIIGIVENMSQGEAGEYPVRLLGSIPFTSTFDQSVVYSESKDEYKRIADALAETIHTEQTVKDRVLLNESIDESDVRSAYHKSLAGIGFINVNTWDYVSGRLAYEAGGGFNDEFLLHCTTDKIKRLVDAFEHDDVAHFMVTRAPQTEIKLIAGEIGEASLKLDNAARSYYGVPRILYHTSQGDVTLFPYEVMPVERADIQNSLEDGAQVTKDGRYLPSKDSVRELYNAFGSRVGIHDTWETAYDEILSAT